MVWSTGQCWRRSWRHRSSRLRPHTAYSRRRLSKPDSTCRSLPIGRFRSPRRQCPVSCRPRVPAAVRAPVPGHPLAPRNRRRHREPCPRSLQSKSRSPPRRTKWWRRTASLRRQPSLRTDSTSPREYSDRFRAPENYRDSNLEEPARRPPEASRRQVPVDYEPQHPEYSMTDTSMGEMKTRSSFEEGCPSVGQSAMETGAVDMLFSYHQMTSDADDGQFSTSTFSSRCSPAVMTSTQPVPSASPRSTVRPTHYYVWHEWLTPRFLHCVFIKEHLRSHYVISVSTELDWTVGSNRK